MEESRMLAFLFVIFALLAVAAFAFFFLCLTPRGFVSPGTGLLLKLAALIAKKGETPWDPALRREKNEADSQAGPYLAATLRLI
jgi:hypothetical protein